MERARADRRDRRRRPPRAGEVEPVDARHDGGHRAVPRGALRLRGRPDVPRLQRARPSTRRRAMRAARLAAALDGGRALVTYPVHAEDAEQFLELRESSRSDGYRRLVVGGRGARDRRGPPERGDGRRACGSRSSSTAWAVSREGRPAPPGGHRGRLVARAAAGPSFAQRGPGGRTSRSRAASSARSARARSTRRGPASSRTTRRSARASRAAASAASSRSTGTR